MACQVPVVSSNAGGLPEVNLHGITGFLADFDDIHSMTAYSLQVLESDASLAQFRANALKQAQTFNLDNILPIYENLYERTLATYTA
jgi:glycosyltransferase involved in cell wall biosynthesis